MSKFIKSVVSSPKRRKIQKRQAHLATLPQPVAALAVGLTQTIGEALLVLTQATAGLALGGKDKIPFAILNQFLQEAYNSQAKFRYEREAQEAKHDVEVADDDSQGE